MGAISKVVRKSSSASARATSARRSSVMSSIWAITTWGVPSDLADTGGVDADPDPTATVGVDQAGLRPGGG